MTVKRVGIVGSGIMGSGIAEVAAKAGYRGRAAQPGAEHGRRDGRGPREVAGQAGRPGQARRRPSATPCSVACARSPTSASSPTAISCIESIVEDLAAEEAPLHRARPHLPRPRDPRDQHVDAARRRDGDGDRPPRQGLRHPLLQPGADDGARRGRARDHVDATRRSPKRPRSRRRAARTRCR